jgi:hypothetical protein
MLIDIIIEFLNRIGKSAKSIVSVTPDEVLETLGQNSIQDIIIEDILGYINYLKASGEEIKEFSLSEKNFYEQMLVIFQAYASEYNTNIPKVKLNYKVIDEYLHFYGFVYNRLANEMQNTTFEIPFSFTLLYYYDQKYCKSMKSQRIKLLSEILLVIYSELGISFIEKTSINNDFKRKYYQDARENLAIYTVELYEEFGIKYENSEIKDNISNNNVDIENNNWTSS